MTDKQKLQKERAWFKYQVSGISFRISNNALTSKEKDILSIIKVSVDYLKTIHDRQSIILGLNVPEYKCWCGKVAKYEPLNYPKYYLGKVCKQHINYII